jgi:hypothetical protein
MPKRASEGATFQVTIAHKYLDAQEMQATLEPAGVYQFMCTSSVDHLYSVYAMQRVSMCAVQVDAICVFKWWA